jgi:hypothetical protein
MDYPQTAEEEEEQLRLAMEMSEHAERERRLQQQQAQRLVQAEQEQQRHLGVLRAQAREAAQGDAAMEEALFQSLLMQVITSPIGASSP